MVSRESISKCLIEPTERKKDNVGRRVFHAGFDFLTFEVAVQCPWKCRGGTLQTPDSGDEEMGPGSLLFHSSRHLEIPQSGKHCKKERKGGQRETKHGWVCMFANPYLSKYT